MRDKLSLSNSTLGRLLRHGIVLPRDPTRGLIVLLRGKAGTGKSTLALQILDQIKGFGPAIYCTLEQSRADLRNKLIAMRIARALDEAQTPHFKADREYFTYEPRPLKESLIRVEMPATAGMIALIKQYNRSEATSLLPLYGEPTAKQLSNNRTLFEELVKLAGKQEHAIGVTIVDGMLEPECKRRMKSETGGARKVRQQSEGPFDGCQSRLMLASHILRVPMEKGRTKCQILERDRLPIVVLDGLSLLSSSEREALQLQGIVEQMRKEFQVGILVYEPTSDTASSLDHHADMVIDLERRWIERPLAYLIHEMCIRKARYQDSALGNHQFKIRGSGLAFFPSIHFQVHHYNYMDLELKRSGGSGWKASTAKPEPPECMRGSLLDLIFAPIPGDSVLLLGSRNSFKTQISLDFLARGHWGDSRPESKPREEGLLISLIDNTPHVERGLKCPCQRGCANCSSRLITHARAFCQRPGYITPAEFFHYLLRRLRMKHNGKPIRRLVFWDITQMDYRFPLFKEDKMLLPALMDAFKTNGIKSLFMGAGNADNTRAASAMADHVLFCWRSLSHWNNSPLHRTKKSQSSLMLYVDRTSAGSGRSGKALYALPVYEGDRLARPEFKADLDKVQLDLGMFASGKSEGFLKIGRDDQKHIDRITMMQGVQ